MQQWYGDIAELGCGGLNIEFPYCSAELVEFFHERFVPVAAWTVDDDEQMNALLETGVHSVTTNRVSRLVELRNNPGLVTKWR
jgi:glycerophosphoryl diester phosphodiesterase